MPEIMTAALIADAAQTGRPLSAFDVITLEHAEAIVQAAEKSSAPVIFQVSRSTVSYHGARFDRWPLRCGRSRARRRCRWLCTSTWSTPPS